MRQTLQEAAKQLLSQPVGSEHTISINTNDGLTGVPPGGPQRGVRIKDTLVRVDEQTREDGKKRRVVKAQAKGITLASSPWAA